MECRSAARVQNEPVPGMRGCAGGKGRFAVPHCCRGTDPPPPAESSSLALPGSGAGRPGRDEGRGNREELWCAALRHGFGKGCLGEAGGTNQKKAPSRVPSLIREGSDRLERGRRFGAKKKPGAQFGSRPLPVAGAVRFDRKLYGITKREGACVGEPQVSATHGAKRKSPPQRAAKEKDTFRCPFLLVRKMGLEPTHRSTGF